MCTLYCVKIYLFPTPSRFGKVKEDIVLQMTEIHSQIIFLHLDSRVSETDSPYSYSTYLICCIYKQKQKIKKMATSVVVTITS